MSLVFNTKAECENCIKDIDKRRGFTGNITVTCATPRVSKDGKFTIPNQKEKHIKEIKQLVRNIKVAKFSENVLSKDAVVEMIDSTEVVKKSFDEDGKDITKYDGSEYELITQKDLKKEYSYIEKEVVEFPVVKEV